MGSITIKHGIEGLYWDPSDYEEIIVRNSRGEFTLHEGLVEWTEVKLNNLPRVTFTLDPHEWFTAHTGMTPKQARRALRKLWESKYREHKQCKAGYKVVDGYPGEYFTVCCGCGEVIESHFNL